jgi:predicted esterase
LVSCNSNTKKESKSNPIKKEVKSDFMPGNIYGTVKCLANPEQTYALYLPSYYVQDKTFPVIFFFDAHERGKMPVENYQQLAETYGFILAGSNNSTNGQSPEESNKAISSMMDDVQKRFQINTERIYTAGFSGGARVAAGVALFKRKITGVIGCGAGFPQVNTQPQTDFIYCGIVGNEDFNYLEMAELGHTLEGSGVYFHPIVFSGKHDWPPSEVMEEAFQFLQFDAMRNKLIPIDNTMINDFIGKCKTDREQYRRIQSILQLIETDQKAITFLSGIYDVSDFSSELTKLKTGKEYLKLIGKKQKMETRENEIQQELIKAMQTENSKWWDSKLNKLVAASEKGKDNELRLMNKRLLNYLSLVSFMYARNALRSGQLEAAGKFLVIYEKVDPDNSEVYYLKAVRLAKMGKNQKAIIELQKAVDKGFEDLNRISNDQNFSAIRDEKGFQDVLDLI